MTARTSSPSCARSWSRRISPRSPDIPPSTAEPPGTPATPSHSGAGRRSRNLSAGSKPSAAWRRPCIAASSVCGPASRWRWRRATSRGCRNCSPPEPESGYSDCLLAHQAASRPAQGISFLTADFFSGLLDRADPSKRTLRGASQCQTKRFTNLTYSLVLAHR